MSVYRADLHVHTCASADGRSTLEELTAAARAAGLDAMAVTDHNLCTPVPPEQGGVLLIPGCEVSTTAGHITGLFLERNVELPGGPGTLPGPEEAVAAIRAAGGLAVLAHPFQRPGRVPADYPFDLDAVETANARAAMKNPEAHAQAEALAARRGLPPVGGSDAHHRGEVGNAYTALEAPRLTLEALRGALAAGACTGVLVRETSHWRKGLSQLRAARRKGGAGRLARGVAYLGWCAWLDGKSLGKRPGKNGK